MKADKPDYIAKGIVAAQTAGKTIYVREGLADALVNPQGENRDLPPRRASIAPEVSAKPARKILSLRDVVKKTARCSPMECQGIQRRRVEGNPDMQHVSTSHVERMNLSIRMQNRRFTRLTNAFSKKLDNHIHALALYFAFYNFCRIHKSLKVTPAMAAGITDRLWSLEDIVAKIDAMAPAPKLRGPYKKRAN